MISRRRFLQGLSLGALSPMVMPLMRYVSANENQNLATRFIFVVEGNGIEPVNLLSSAARQDIDSWSAAEAIGNSRVFTSRYTNDAPRLITSSDMSAMHSGFSDARSLDALGGASSLEQDTAAVFGLSNTIAHAGDNHTASYGALACVKPTGVPNTPTIDHLLAQLDAVRGVGESMDGRGRTPFDALRYGIHGGSSQFAYGLCARGNGEALPVLTRPDTAYQNLFGPISTGETRRRFNARNKMLAFAQKDADRVLRTLPSGSDEYARLEIYLRSLVELEESYSLLGSDYWRGELGRVLPDYGPGEIPTPGMPAFDSPHPFDQLTLQFEVGMAAILGGLTNMLVLSSGAAGNWDINHTSLSFPGITEDIPGRHKSLHNGGGKDIDDKWAEYPRQVTRRNVDMIATMARRLKSVPEGDGTMLDRTLIVYMSNNGETHHSTKGEWPLLLIGGKGLGFKTDGRTVVYPRYGSDNNRRMSNLFNTMSHAARNELNDFGAENLAPERQGELTELWAPVT